jgi:predicted permease
MDQWMLDVRYALRGFAKSPGFAALVVLALALGIGANATIFTLINQILLQPLPVRDPERLVVIEAPGPYSGSTHSQSAALTPLSHAMFVGLRDRTEVFAGVLAHCRATVHLASGSETESVEGDLVSGSFFEVLGLQPAAGRLLTPDDDKDAGAHPVVVLGHGYWSRRFGAARDVVGRTVAVNGHPMTVVGVAPAGFHGIEVGAPTDVYVPLAMQPQVQPTWPLALGSWRMRWLTAVARLKDGLAVETAQAGANVAYRQLLEEDLATMTTRSESFRARFREKQVTLLPGGRGTSELRGQSQATLLVLMGMVVLVLLIACANVASLLLARATGRQKEIAVRQALGAGRARLVRQLLAESLLLALAGGALGLVVASYLGDLLVRALPYTGAALALSAAPDAAVLGFTFGLSLLTGLVFGLAPAFQSTRPDLAPTLKGEAGAVIGGSAPLRLRRGLVVAQVSLSLLLLVGAGLFSRSLSNLSRLDPGFAPQRVLAFSVDPSRGGHALERRASLLKRITEELLAEPGVVSAAAAEVALMTNSNSSSTIRVEGYESKEEEDMNPGFNGVGPGFFATLGIPLRAGRDFTDADVRGAPKVAVVNETFVRYFFKDADPIGRRFGLRRDGDRFDYTIVGVVPDGKSASLRETPGRFIYTPYAQSETLGGVTFYVRTTGDPAALGGRARQVVRAVDPTLPVTDLKTMQAQIGESLFVERMVAALSGAFGLLATLLAVLGLYGVMSYAVGRRTREIGVRVALGAQRGDVLGLVLRDVALLVAAGLAIGLPGGYALGRAVESQLFGLDARDPLTFGLAALVLGLAALAAGYLPASRAARLDPMAALRQD